MKEDDTTESHVHAHAQLSEINIFQHTLEAENKEDLAYDDGQDQKEAKEDIKHSSVVLEEVEIRLLRIF